ncbi:MAG: fused MFS/spermidine synthase [Candidatus Omnitrophica bacterium]|nr:fused MFS/spermidine synthase [Candidatus Omnitrophota bacterium]
MPSRKSKYFEYNICFISGFSILSLEIISFRIFTPYFGTATYTSGIIINTILLSLALGYLLGGIAAHKFKSYKLPCFMILGSSLYLLAVLFYYPFILKTLTFKSLIMGCITAVLILFSLPMILLAMVSPYLIKLLHVKNDVGKISGKIFALSTLGSVVGGSFTTFIFIPSFGSKISFSIIVYFLIAISIIGLIKYNKRYSLVLVLLIPFYFLPSNKQPKDTIYKGESEHNVITITKKKKHFYLKLGINSGYHSKSFDFKNYLTKSRYDYFLFPQLLLNAKNTLVLGNAVGVSMSQIHTFFDTNIDGVEIDAKLTNLGKQYFGLKIDKKLSIFHEDARTFLYNDKKKYDIIYLDVYTGNSLIPFHVTTIEFFKLLDKKLNKKGIIAINLPYFPLESKFIEYYLNTIIKVFPNSYFFSKGFIVYAFKDNIDKKTMYELTKNKEIPNQLSELSTTILLKLKKINKKNSKNIFKDDYAPVEKMTYHIFEEKLRNIHKDLLNN